MFSLVVSDKVVFFGFVSLVVFSFEVRSVRKRRLIYTIYYYIPIYLSIYLTIYLSSYPILCYPILSYPLLLSIFLSIYLSIYIYLPSC